MLMIRETQVNRLESVQQASFEDRCLAFLTQQFPEQVAMSGEARIRERIRADTQRAFAQDITNEPDVMKYLYLTNLLGGDFDADPRYRWLAPTLEDRRQAPGARLDQAMDAVADRLDRGIDLADPVETSR